MNLDKIYRRELIGLGFSIIEARNRTQTFSHTVNSLALYHFGILNTRSLGSFRNSNGIKHRSWKVRCLVLVLTQSLQCPLAKIRVKCRNTLQFISFCSLLPMTSS
jgi:hypothetical protein